MYYVEKIHMNPSFPESENCIDIESLYIDFKDIYGLKAYLKSEIYDYLKSHPKTISVNIAPYPVLIPALSSKYEKYVRSENNDTVSDNLLKLPRI
ncbi:MAG: DUF3892 domain-containing protein [Sphaerochaetaceae bacterium]